MTRLQRLGLALLLAPAALLTASDPVTVKRFVVNAGTPQEPFPMNSYLVLHAPSRSAVLIDPGALDERLAAFTVEQGLQVRMVLNTHGHWDHSAGNAAACEKFVARLAAPAADRLLYEKSGGAARVDLWLQDGQELDCGGITVRVIATPGHTPGSVCFLIGGQLFSGDTLFAGSVGRVPKGKNEKKALQALARVIREKLLVLPADTPVWPGHGQPTTIGEETLLNPFLN